jgi:hypothetical protein
MRGLAFIYVLITGHLLPFSATGQEFMPQGTFVQTCSPVWGETYIFSDHDFWFYSDDQKFFGNGNYKLRGNRLSLTFSEPGSYPKYIVTSCNKVFAEKKGIMIRLFSPGRNKNEIGVKITVLDSINQPVAADSDPVVDSTYIQIGTNQNHITLKITHPQEEELLIPIMTGEQQCFEVEVFYQNNWESVQKNTKSRFKLQNIRTSSFLLEKTLIKKKYFCVFIRKDQALKLMEQSDN